MKTVGIIGGFGPETTAKFMMLLLSKWQKINKTQRPEILLWNAPVNNKSEGDFIESGKNSKEFLHLLLNGAKILEKAGADFLVLPCNSLHIFITEIRKSVHIPTLNIIEQTARKLKEDGCKKIGIFSSGATKKFKIFEKEFDRNGITPAILNDTDQKILNQIIENLVVNKKIMKDTKRFKKIANSLKFQGISNILLACTDLQLLDPKIRNIKFIDTFEILAEATVDKMLQE